MPLPGHFSPTTSQLSGSIASGQLNDGSVVSGTIASGQIGRYHLASGTVIDLIACEQALSGITAVAWGSGRCFVVPAERASGLRLPAIGVVAGSFASGAVVPVVRLGIVSSAVSGLMYSGKVDPYIYVGSGGLLIGLSGYLGGASSGAGAGPLAGGAGALSGVLTQRIGIPVSGGIDVNIGEISSGLSSGLLGVY